jgi:hypothetical protein
MKNGEKRWPWVPSDDELLRRMLAAGESPDAVAAKMGRTKASIVTRASALKVSIRRQPVHRELMAKAK